MSREVINLQVGQAGNQVGESFWKEALSEHGIDFSGKYVGTNSEIELAGAGVYFSEISSAGGSRYVPRSVQIDLENSVVDVLRSGPLGGLFKPDSYLSNVSGAGNNWAKGFYTEGAELIDSILDLVRKQAEDCDCFQGFQLIHSLGGGTGAGLGSLLLSKLREEYPDRMLATCSIFPSPKTSETVVEPYNSMLSIHQLLDSSDLTICIDNEALYDISMRALHVDTPSFATLNGVISKVLCGASTSLRFPGQLNGDLRKLAMNLIPFPRLHFLMPSYAPLVDLKQKSFHSFKVSELTSSLFDKKNALVACDPRFGRYLTAATIFRGKVSSSEVESAVQDIQRKDSTRFVEWIPDNVSISLCPVAPAGLPQAAIALSNTTAIQEIFHRNLSQFTAMFKRRAFLHWYTDEGMDAMEFTEAESNCYDLIAEYQQYQEATAESMYDEYSEHDGGSYAESAVYEQASYAESAVYEHEQGSSVAALSEAGLSEEGGHAHAYQHIDEGGMTGEDSFGEEDFEV